MAARRRRYRDSQGKQVDGEDLTKFRMDEISAVDAGTQDAIGTVLAKRRPATSTTTGTSFTFTDVPPHTYTGMSPVEFTGGHLLTAEAVRKAVEAGQSDEYVLNLIRSTSKAPLIKQAAATTLVNDHVHLALISRGDGELNHGITSWANNHDHGWIRLEDGTIRILPALTPGDGAPHEHQIEALSKSAPGGDSVDASSEEGPPADSPADGVGAGDDMTKPKDGQGADDAQTADLTKKLTDENAALKKSVERLEKVGSLSPEERKRFESFAKDAEKGAFLALDSDGRRGEIAKSLEADPVVYTSDVTGESFRKSDPRLTLQKSHDGLAKRLAHSEAATAQAKLEKRAGEELPNMKGSLLAKAALLKSIESITDETLRNEALESLKAQDNGVGEILKTRGTSDSPIEAGSPDAELDTMTKAYIEKHAGTSEAEAYGNVIATEKGSELLAKSLERSMNGRS